jgi:hypothetical protein
MTAATRLSGRLLAGSVALVALLPGCAAFSPDDLAEPGTITVADAMADVGRGFKAMKTELDAYGPLKTGLRPCKVTVNFNVSAKASMGGQLTLQASTQPTQTQTTQITNTVNASGTFTQTNTSEATRGNVVVVELYSLACTPKDTLATINPTAIGTVADVVQTDAGKTQFSILPGERQ